MIEFSPTLTEKQTIAWDHLENPEVDEVGYGGAKYGGKSWLFCVWFYIFACNFAKVHKIPKSAHPLPIGFLGRKVAKNFRDTTLETWFKTIPPGGYVAKGNPVDLIIDDRVKFHTGGLDNRETVNKFNSAEYAVFGLDQAEETTRDEIALLRAATFGRLVVNGKPIAGKGLFTANPAACWFKDEFITAPTKRRRFVPALPTDNPYCTQKYIDNLKDAFKHRPKLLAAYLHGDWDVLEGVDQVIQSAWIRAAAERTVYWPTVRKLLTCDCARFGDDETVIYYLENTEIEDTVIMAQSPTTQISGRLAKMSIEHGDCDIVVETTGSDLGAGVIDELIDLDRNVYAYYPQAKIKVAKGGQQKYYNKRAEVWDYVAKMFAKSEVDLKNTEPELINQLCTPTYKFRQGKMLIESKDDIKARLLRSPDRADALVQGLYHLQLVSPEKEHENDYGRRKENVPNSAMVC